MATKTTIGADGMVTSFRDWVKADGSTEFKPEPDRYHLYVQFLCPFAQRAMTGRSLKGLEHVITQDNVDFTLESSEKGWVFSPKKDGCDADSVNGAACLRDIYDASAKKLGASGYMGKTTVPVLYDKKSGRIVSSESADILHMLNSEFNELCETEEQKCLDLYPPDLQQQISEVQSWTLKQIILGVYRPLFFAKTQDDYDEAIELLYSGLDRVEALLSQQRYLTGGQLTAADIHLFCTLIRFDAVYCQCFCAKRRICDYPALWGYVRDIYQMEAVRKTIHFDQIMKGYFTSYYFRTVNPHGIVPVRPDLDYDALSGRDTL